MAGSACPRRSGRLSRGIGPAKPIALSFRIDFDIEAMTDRPKGLPRAHRWAGVSGIATGLLFALANSLWAFDQPARGASSAELLDFYAELAGEIVAGALVSLISIAAFVVFAGALREVLVELEGDALLANVAFGGTLLTAAAGIGAETINMAAALRAADDELTAPLAQALFDSSYVLGYYGAGVGLALVALAARAAALRSGALMPRWLAIVGLLLAATLITPLVIYTIGPSFLFLVAISALLLRGAAVRA